MSTVAIVNDIKLEVCVDSIESAIAAADGGAARLELCSALMEGGLTPTVGTLKSLKNLPLNIPIFCMLRPRRGTDFDFTELEVEALLHDMELLRANGADGFVFGALTPQRSIDVNKCQRVVSAAAGLPVTFHRAFDLTDPNHMHETVQRIKEIGFKRLLTSGFRATAMEGSTYLAELIAKHHRDFIVMPGAGINVGNLDDLLTITKCREFHASAKASTDLADGDNVCMDLCEVSMGKQDSEPYRGTNIDVVRKLVAIANNVV